MPVPLIHSIRCNNCGASLQIPQEVRFITCQHCKAELQVEQTLEGGHTRIIEVVAKRIDKSHEELEEVALEQWIDRLDSEGENKRDEIFGPEALHNPKEAADSREKFWAWFLPALGFVTITLLWLSITQGDGGVAFAVIIASIFCMICLGFSLSKHHLFYRQELNINREQRRTLDQSTSSNETDS